MTALAAGLALAGCGSGSSGGNAGGLYGGVPNPNPSTAPSNPPANQPGNAKRVQLKGGAAFVDATSGLALYTSVNDTRPNQSNCTGGCLAIWPPHSASAGDTASGNFTIFTRSDNGTRQWAYKTKPLYTFASDSTGNNGTGDGVEGFHIARP